MTRSKTIKHLSKSYINLIKDYDVAYAKNPCTKTIDKLYPLSKRIYGIKVQLIEHGIDPLIAFNAQQLTMNPIKKEALEFFNKLANA